MTDFDLSEAMRDDMRAAWHRYIDVLVPFRPDLFRYCQRLTGDLWDAQDLVQDTLVKGFGTLGSVYHVIDNPRAWLLRIATNQWIDTVRRRGLEAKALAAEVKVAKNNTGDSASPSRSAEMHNAAETLMQRLSPQEQAAVVLKDAFDLSLDETAQVIGTTVGAVKAALHRGRARLKDTATDSERPLPSPELVEAFVSRYNEQDLPGLMSLMLDSASVDMLSHVSETGREAFERDRGWFWHNFNVEPHWPKEFLPEKIDWRCVEFQGESIALVLNTFQGMEFLGSVMRLEELDGNVAKIRVYACCPEVVQAIGAAFDLQTLPPLYRIPDAFEPNE
jgi:RNA polymerase sigma-70 factor (ECF subfamily)